MAFRSYKSLFQHWNSSFVLSTKICVLFCVVYCHIGLFSEAAALTEYHEGNKEEHPTSSFTEGRPVNQNWISFPEATLVSLGLLISVVLFVLLCSGGCCLNIFGKRGSSSEVRIQGFDNPISELGPISLSPIDVRALQTNVDSVVFEPLPSVIDLTPLPVAPIAHRGSVPNIESSSPWEPANSKSTTIPSGVKKDPITTNASNILLLSVESFTQPQIRLNENNNNNSSIPLPESSVIYEQPKIKIEDRVGSSLSSNSQLPNPLSTHPISNQTALENKTFFQVTPTAAKITTAAAATINNITPVTSNQSSSDSNIPDISFTIIPPTPIPVVSQKEEGYTVKPSIDSTKILHEKICSNNTIQSSDNTNINNNINNNTSLQSTTPNNDDNSSDYTTINTSTSTSNVDASVFENKEKKSFTSFETKSERTDEAGKNESQEVNVNTIISVSDISSCNSSNDSNNSTSSSSSSNNNNVNSHLRITQEVGRKEEEKVISCTPAATPLNLNEPTLQHALLKAPTKQSRSHQENIKSYGLKNTFEYTFQDSEVSCITPQLNEEKEKNSSSSLKYINESSNNTNSNQKAIINSDSFKSIIDLNDKSISEGQPSCSVTHLSETCSESNGTVESTTYYYDETSNEKEKEKDKIMYTMEQEKIKQNIKEQRHYNPNLRKTSTPNNSPPHKNLGQRIYKNETLDELVDTENPTNFFSRTADDVFDDFSMEFSSQISPISKGSDTSNISSGTGVKLDVSVNDDQVNRGSNVVLGASDDLGLGFYQRVTTELDLKSVSRILKNQATDDDNVHDQYDSSNDGGIQRVNIPSLLNSKVNIHCTLPTGTATTIETNNESRPMELCSSVDSTDPFASNHEDGERVAYHDTFDLMDKKFEKKIPISTDSNHKGDENMTADNLDEDDEKTVKPNQKNFLLKSNQNPLTNKVIPRKLFTEGESLLSGEIGDVSNETSDTPYNQLDNINSAENSSHKGTNIIIKASLLPTCTTSTTSSSGTSIEFSSATNNTTVLNKATMNKDVVESNKTDSKNDETSLPINFKLGLTTLLAGESTTVDSIDNNSMLNNINMKTSDKFVEDIEAEIEEFGSLVMTDLEDNEENPRKELVKETREGDYSSIQRVIAFEDSSNKNTLVCGTSDPGTLLLKETKLDMDKKSRETSSSSSSSSMEIDKVPSDFEISSKSNLLFHKKDNEIEREEQDDGNKTLDENDSGREISYLPLNHTVELVKDTFENSRTFLVTDFESDEHADDDNDENNDNDDDHETVSRDIREFVPSKWNQKLTPQKSAIKSPLRPAIKSPEQQKTQNTSFESTSVGNTNSRVEKSSLKKSVSFERKKTQLVYEYPPAPVTDSDEEEKQQKQQKIQPLSNNGQLNLFLDWELQPDELENTDVHGDDWEDEFLKPRTTNNPIMDMYRISGFESTPIPPSRSNPLPLPTSSTSTLGELRHTKSNLKLDLNIGEACFLDSETNDFKPHVGQQQQLDSGVGSIGSSNVSPFNNYCDNH